MNISLSLLRKAFFDVKENHGCAGVDGITIGKFETDLNDNLKKLEYELEEQTYFPLPLMRILVAKKNGEPRNLSIPTVRDRVVQRSVLYLVEPIIEKELENCSYAYRKGRSVKNAIYKIKEYHEQGYQWVVDADIDAFFDNVNHQILFKKFNTYISEANIRSLIEKWVKIEVWDGDKLMALQKGIPQGSSISPILANLFLDELDEDLLEKGYKYIRYADDYVILCKNRTEAKKALNISKDILEKLDLELDDEEIVSFKQGFKYLGVIFLNKMIMKPFETKPKKSNVLQYPKPFDLEGYLLNKRKE